MRASSCRFSASVSVTLSRSRLNLQARLAHQLAHGVRAPQAEPRRPQAALVQPALAVAVGVHAGGLGEHVLADDRLVGRDPAAREVLDELADAGQRPLVDVRPQAAVVAQRHDDLVERRVAGPFPHAVDRAVDAARAAQRRLQRVGRRQPVVVVAVEVEAAGRKLLRHPLDERPHLRRAQDAEGVAQHQPLHRHAGERRHVAQHVVGRVAHAARPVLQVDVEHDAVPRAVVDRPADVVDVLLRRAPQLFPAVLERALGQQVDHAAAHGPRPVDRRLPVDEPQHLDAVRESQGVGPVRDAADGAALAVARASGRDLDPVHLDLFQQAPGDGQLLGGRHRHAFRLLAVPEGGVQDLDERPGARRAAGRRHLQGKSNQYHA